MEEDSDYIPPSPQHHYRELDQISLTQNYIINKQDEILSHQMGIGDEMGLIREERAKQGNDLCFIKRMLLSLCGTSCPIESTSGQDSAPAFIFSFDSAYIPEPFVLNYHFSDEASGASKRQSRPYAKGSGPTHKQPNTYIPGGTRPYAGLTSESEPTTPVGYHMTIR